MIRRITPLVSVVIPAFNAAETIARTLYSVATQDYPAIEVLVVDDGSSDQTADLAALTACPFPLQVVRKSNGGVASARNAGILNSRGEWVAFLDADDLWHPTKISKQMSAAEHGRAGLVYCFSRGIDASGRIFFTPTTPPRAGDVYASLIINNFLGNGSAAVIRRDLLLTCGGFNESLNARDAQGCEDLELYLKIARCHDFACVDECLVGYRLHSNSMSSDLERMLRSWELVMDAEWALFPSNDLRLRQAGRATILRWLAISARKQGRYGSAARLLLRAAMNDPGGTLCYLSARIHFRLSSISQRSVTKAETVRNQAGSHFLDASPERHAVIDRCERMHDRLAAKMKRPQAGPPPTDRRRE